jgi:hypothetical protein
MPHSRGQQASNEVKCRIACKRNYVPMEFWTQIEDLQGGQGLCRRNLDALRLFQECALALRRSLDVALGPICHRGASGWTIDQTWSDDANWLCIFGTSFAT